MVSIPTNQIKNIIYFDKNLEKENLKKLKPKLKIKSVLKDAQNNGYFVNVTTVYLNERFNVKDNYSNFSDYENMKKLSSIDSIDLHDSKIQGLRCLEYCTGLLYLNLSNNYISDITPLKSCTKLICLDVSSNVIEGLPEPGFWAGLRSLRILYIHDNPISEPDSVIGLSDCTNLNVLTLSNSPLSLKRKYRHFLVNSLWSLKVLDNFLVSDEEIIEDADFRDSYFRTQGPGLRIQSYRFFKMGTDSINMADVFRKFLAYINQQMAHISPVIIIQRYIRGFLCRNKNNLVKWNSKSQKSKVHKMPLVLEEKPLVDEDNEFKEKELSNKEVQDKVKYLKIDLKHLQTSLTIETLEREALLMESMAPGYNGYTFRSIARSDLDKCSKEQISRALRKDGDQSIIEDSTVPDMNECATFRLMGINFSKKSMDHSAEIMKEKNRSHYVIREADRMFHENKLSFILPEIKSRPVIKTNSNILLRKCHGCMGLLLLNKWDKTDRAVLAMDTYHEKIAKIEAIKFERDMKQQENLERKVTKIGDIRKCQEENIRRLSDSKKIEQELHRQKVEDVRIKQERLTRQKSQIKKEISFSVNFSAKQSAATNALDRFERMAIRQDQKEANVSRVQEMREIMDCKMETVKLYLENEVCNRRTETSLEKSALNMKLFDQMNSRMDEAKRRVERQKAIRRLVSCPKMQVIDLGVQGLPSSS